MHFSKTTGCFYPQGIKYSDLPDDLIEVTQEEFDTAMARRPGDTLDVLSGHIVVVPKPVLVMDLASARAAKVAAINAERDQREAAGFPYRGKVLDSTPRSVQRITAAALATQAALAAGQQFQIDWTCADNSVLALDAAGLIGMPVALAQHAAAMHAHARQLKAAVEAAASKEELAAIDIHAGWPGGAA